ncbi:NAD(P)/FAD-dependent oxidoreductase [Streptacidiphilus monticola]|uniref:NAD(P)/FAD-dependent oxidoreductase n=1 Tax=Streptacidiphilus monticola TaxID=2161674 RepID=A0ABW1FXN4_9ACTN
MTDTTHPAQNPQLPDYDVLVVGGGAAGLSGALMLARARRSVAVVDAGEPRNAPADGVHGLLARDGMPPGELLARGREEVRRYGGTVLSGEAVAVAGAAPGFTVTLADGTTLRARRLLVTTGLVDELPDVPGLREHWGRDLVHCPYCHGWEVRDRAVGVLATGPMSVHQALLFRQWTDDVVLFGHGGPEPTAAETEQLTARGIRIVPGKVTAVETTGGGGVAGLRLADGTVVPREVLAVAPRMVARGALLAALGLTAEQHPSRMGEFIPSEQGGRTAVPGVWVAGNITDLSAQVGGAAAAGALAGAMINADLVTEETAAAVAALRGR